MINNEINGQQTLVDARRMTDTPIKAPYKQVNQKLQEEAALWHCQSCQIWWGSGSNMRESSALMQYVAKMTLPEVWDDYRGWHSATTGTTCPQCGRAASLLLQPHAVMPKEQPQPQLVTML